jgi:hypothetical protein
VQLTSRRRWLAAVATATVAMALAAVATGRGCTPLDATPEGAVRAFASAARSGDRRAVWSLLGPRTRARFEEEAANATRTVGGERRFVALDMLRVGSGDTDYAPTGYRLVERSGEQATVEVSGPGGRRDSVRVVKVGDRWRVELFD